MANVRVRVPVPALAPGEHALGPSVARYLAVHRLRAGDRFLAFDPERALEADTEIVSLVGTELLARVGALRAAAVVATREVTWIQGLPKGEKMDSIVRDATELGATCIVPVVTTFTVVKLDGPRREAKRGRWSRIAIEAARQCGRGDAPVVLAPMTWSEALLLAGGLAPPERSRGLAPPERSDEARAFCLYENATVPLGPLLLEATRSAAPLVFAAGPEGGLSSEEVGAAEAHGWRAVSLGQLTLRAETVAAATLGALAVVGGIARR